jgi:HlyD family secretion protein
MKTFFGFAFVLVAVGAGAAFYYNNYSPAAAAPTFKTVEIKKGDLVSTIGATGTVEPEEVVDVGAQVMGLILDFGQDPHDPKKVVDYGTTVEKGTVLAHIDPTPYQASAAQAEAALERSKADLLQLEAKLAQAEQDWKRAESLRPLKAIADTDYDAAKANFKIATASVAVGKAAVRQSEASLQVANTNLGYTTIKSPVRGVIVDRRVNIGQTVVSALNAPSLFLIAKDLRRMQIWASVNEADIGRIRVDMPVQFTVDAYPGRQFHGSVSQIRLNASSSQNVVTYTVVVTTENPDGKLLPYLTSNVQFEVDKRTDVLMVPNAALRWKPPASPGSKTDKDEAKDDKGWKGGKEGKSGKWGRSRDATAEIHDRGKLWVPGDAGSVQAVDVEIGLTDGIMTQVLGSGVKEGMEVVVGSREGAGAAGDESFRNPFLPKLPKGPRPPGPPM